MTDLLQSLAILLLAIALLAHIYADWSRHRWMK